MIDTAELPQAKEIELRKNEVFTEEEITEYRRGCELVGLKLGEALDNTLEKGKRPTILIPSRGAIPIFLLAVDFLRKSGDHRLSGAQTDYYPAGIFEYLSDSIKDDVQGHIQPEIDVILYPFTADLSAPNEQETELDKKVRASCAAAFSDLVYGDKSSIDLQWNFFLMQKFREGQYGNFILSPAKIVESLKSIPKNEDREIILIDTVISGRAASDITGAFRDLGHKVTPILAVDSKSGVKLRKDYKSNIRNALNNEFVENFEDQLIEFPLISEDKGAALLGVSAVNFANFNDENLFHKSANGFPESYTPQSCVWMIPPRPNYIHSFHGFLERCKGGFDLGDNTQKIAWEKLSDDIREFITSRADGEEVREDMNGLLKVPAESANETASHIISLKLSPKDAAAWIREFSLKFLT